ncbi:hypothetical protein [Consotaella aegiceratis]|uniref:hypothetical protein n=1 Tax=Consotaella aegiceratis TaxID=3097961 RepID=UPI002F42606C
MMGTWLGPVVTATLISSLIAALGWYVSWRTARGLDRQRRQERIDDIQTALLAEVRSIVHHLDQYDAADLIGEVESRMQANNGYSPFIPREPHPSLFEAISAEISVLPRRVIDPVVLFYRQQEVIANFAEDLRGGDFRSMRNEQKIQMIKDYLHLKEHAGRLGHEAINALKRELEIALNRSDADR